MFEMPEQCMFEGCEDMRERNSILQSKLCKVQVLVRVCINYERRTKNLARRLLLLNIPAILGSTAHSPETSMIGCPYSQRKQIATLSGKTSSVNLLKPRNHFCDMHCTGRHNSTQCFRRLCNLLHASYRVTLFLVSSSSIVVFTW